MTSLPKWALGALAFVALSFGLASPAQAFHGHRGGVSISFGDPYGGAYFSAPIGHRYHQRHYPGCYGGYGYYPYTYYQPRYRYEYRYRPHPRYYGYDYRWRDYGWRHHPRHWRRHFRHHRWH